MSNKTLLDYDALHSVNKIEELFSNGADPNIQNARGDTPLHYAIHNYGKLDIITILLLNGANPNIPNMFGSTALHIAASYSMAEVCHLLLRFGADPTLKNNKGQIPVHVNILQCTPSERTIRTLNHYFPTFHDLTLRSIGQHRIKIQSLPPILISE